MAAKLGCIVNADSGKDRVHLQSRQLPSDWAGLRRGELQNTAVPNKQWSVGTAFCFVMSVEAGACCQALVSKCSCSVPLCTGIKFWQEPS